MKDKVIFYLDPKVKGSGIAFEAPRAGDAGFDIRCVEDIVLEAGKQALVSTGLKVVIPSGWVGVVKDRSSMALKRVYTHAGVIDAAYRGEVKIVLSNHSPENLQLEAGTKIAQMVVLPHITACQEVDSEAELGNTDRGDGGFGSTGK